MVTLKIKVTFDEEVLGTANANPDIHQEWIASKANDEAKAKEEVEAINSEETFEKSMTIFPKDKNGNPFVWDYQWKGYLKDAFKALKKVPKSECGKIKAYKQEIDGLIFPAPRKIKINIPEGESIGICQRPLRASTPQGERVALASSETAPEGSTMEFEIILLADMKDSNVHEKAVIEALNYGRLRGFGQWRNASKGRFHYEILERKVD
jgi:hypothetical protein